MFGLWSVCARYKLSNGNSGHPLALKAAAVNNSSDFPNSNRNSGYCLFNKTGSGCLLCLLVACDGAPSQQCYTSALYELSATV